MSDFPSLEDVDYTSLSNKSDTSLTNGVDTSLEKDMSILEDLVDCKRWKYNVAVADVTAKHIISVIWIERTHDVIG